MSIINIQDTVSSHPLLERLNLFPGRTLGEAEFDKQQQYTDFRLQQVAQIAAPGILKGLEVLSRDVSSQWISIGPGQAVDAQGQVIGLSHGIRQSWANLIRQYLSESEQVDARGIYYLCIRRTTDNIDASNLADSCRQQSVEPQRDIQKVIKGELCLKRLAVSASLLNVSAQQIANHVCAMQIDDHNYSFMNNTLPVALLGINKDDDFFSPIWLDPVAGRYLATSDNLYQTLSKQVQNSINSLTNQYALSTSDSSFNDFFEQQAEINFLPAAGELPLSLLENPQSFIYTNSQGKITRGPKVRFLPAGHNIDMIPVPVSAIDGIMHRELQRGYIDLSEPGQSIRLLLAVRDQDYSRDLLDFPTPDKSIENALYKYFMLAHKDWIAWKKQFYNLYYVLDKTSLSKEQFDSLQLPKSIRFPQPAADFFQQLIKQEMLQRNIKDPIDLPLPYRNGVPVAPDFYNNWLDNNRIPLPPRPDQNGLAPRLILNSEAIEETQNRIRSQGILLQKTQDLLVVQRQQLDQNTIAMATLAGGIASDGSGMQIARWWPHMTFNTEEEVLRDSAKDKSKEETATAAEATNTDSSSGSTNTLMASFKYNLYTPPLNFAPPTTSPRTNTVSNINNDSGYLRYLKTDKTLSSLIKQDSSILPLFAYQDKMGALDSAFSQAKSKVSEAQFNVGSDKFGVLKHLEPEKNEYKIAYEGLIDLYTIYIDIYGEKDYSQLKKQLDGIYIPEDPDKLLAADKKPEANAADNSNIDTVTVTAADKDSQNRRIQGITNKALFNISRVLTKFISIVESRNNNLSREIQTAQKQLRQLQAVHIRLIQSIELANAKLAKLNSQRLESLSDYNMTQSLLKEEWQRVEDRHEQRKRILRSLKGLYYVKVRRTPISRAVAGARGLYYKYENRLLPGCSDTREQDIPDALDYFLDAVLEIPISQWRQLARSKTQLVNINSIEKIHSVRQSRINIMLNGMMSGIPTPFINLGQQNRTLVADLAQQRIDFSQSRSRIIYQAQHTLSLEDISRLKTGALKTTAQQLKDQLSQCILCLLDNLYKLSPAIRLQWAQLAEDDQLVVEQFKRWPGLQISDRNDIEPVKNIRQLIEWWFKQLNTEQKFTVKKADFKRTSALVKSIPGSSISASSFTALRNMIRAILIESAYGDSSSIIEGKIHIIPPLFIPGEIIRVKLNHPAAPGLKLDILSPAQVKIGQVVVEDDDEQGTVTRIINTLKTDIKLTTQFSVIQLTDKTVSPQTKTGRTAPLIKNFF